MGDKETDVVCRSPGIEIEKEWILVYADHELLRAETQAQLKEKASRTRTPDGAEVCAVPKPHRNFFL